MSIRQYMVLLGLFLSSCVYSWDHLVPDDKDGLLSLEFRYTYHTKLRELLMPSYESRNIEAMAYITPSFEPEKTIGISYIGGEYFIFGDSLSVNLWTFASLDEEIFNYYLSMKNMEFEEDGITPISEKRKKAIAGLPDSFDYKKIKVNNCTQKIDSQLAEKILGIWRKMVLDVRQPTTSQGGFDGTNYYFEIQYPRSTEYQEDHFQSISTIKLYGKTHSPDTGSSVGKFVKLINVLSNSCETNEVSEKEIESAIPNF